MEKNKAIILQLSTQLGVTPDKVMETLRAQLKILKERSEQTEYNELMEAIKQKNNDFYLELTQEPTQEN